MKLGIFIEKYKINKFLNFWGMTLTKLNNIILYLKIYTTEYFFFFKPENLSLVANASKIKISIVRKFLYVYIDFHKHKILYI